MNIPCDLLCQYGAVNKNYRHHDDIFREGQVAFYYFQIVSGLVKMINHGEEHDFIQGIFTEGDSFGEPPLIGEFPYPAGARAITDIQLLALPRKHFITLLREHFEVHLHFTQLMCQRVLYKAEVLKTINLGHPEERILAVIDLLKTKLSRERYSMDNHFVVPVTRQDIADMTGLRVETVIRKVGLLAEQGRLSVSDRKILRAYEP
ncbi:MAG: Crp/Fnr family transcriptional regulator [Lewinellaceae bacterium]|nr:Crp/Fnr family transcriptional regulator [Lewinellaceae bacterium]MCB9354002.1 Crp/Fnr family transcriptional regulator [Lewinellaceae bacterium]